MSSVKSKNLPEKSRDCGFVHIQFIVMRLDARSLGGSFMVKFEIYEFIRRSPEAVFDYFADPANLPQWQSYAEHAEWVSHGEPGVGSVFKVIASLGGSREEVRLQVAIWERPLPVCLPLDRRTLSNQETGGLHHADGEGERDKPGVQGSDRPERLLQAGGEPGQQAAQQAGWSEHLPDEAGARNGERVKPLEFAQPGIPCSPCWAACFFTRCRTTSGKAMEKMKKRQH